MANPTSLSRFTGCLIGGAAGDALGYPVEFMSYESICETFGPQGIRSYWLEETGGTALFSDDTQMTLFTGAGLLDAGVDATYARLARSIHRAYLDWLHTQDSWYHKNPGITWLLDVPQLYSRRAPGNTCLSALASGKMGLMEEPLNNSCGCGGVMRVAPVGLFLADSDEAAHVAAIAAALTHGHPMGYVPAAALAYLVNRCVYGDATPLSELVEACAEQLPQWFEDEQYAARDMARQLRYAAELAVGDAPDAQNIPLLGEGWVGDEALAIAVYACLRHPDDFSEASLRRSTTQATLIPPGPLQATSWVLTLGLRLLTPPGRPTSSCSTCSLAWPPSSTRPVRCRFNTLRRHVRAVASLHNFCKLDRRSVRGAGR